MSNNNNFMQLPDDYATVDSFFHILPVAFEGEVTYGKGASKGPQEIINAAQHLEYYDEECNNEPFLKGIHLHTPLNSNSQEEIVQQTKDRVTTVLDNNQFPLILGGDHSVTIGAVKALHDEVGVLVFDAHSDFRDQWHNSALNHACVGKQSAKNHKTLFVGMRSQDADEAKAIKQDANMTVLKMCDWSVDEFQKEILKLPKKLYISIDVDCFDPSFIKNTGTPEPGGFTYREILAMLRITFEQKEILGADIVEFAPNEHFHAESYSLARLAYKIMALKLQNN